MEKIIKRKIERTVTLSLTAADIIALFSTQAAQTRLCERVDQAARVILNATQATCDHCHYDSPQEIFNELVKGHALNQDKVVLELVLTTNEESSEDEPREG